jgi:hypothetical protein
MFLRDDRTCLPKYTSLHPSNLNIHRHKNLRSHKLLVVTTYRVILNYCRGFVWPINGNPDNNLESLSRSIPIQSFMWVLQWFIRYLHKTKFQLQIWQGYSTLLFFILQKSYLNKRRNFFQRQIFSELDV